MNNLTYQQIFDDVLISTDKALLNVDTIHHYLSTQSYWALILQCQSLNELLKTLYALVFKKKYTGWLCKSNNR